MELRVERDLFAEASVSSRRGLTRRMAPGWPSPVWDCSIHKGGARVLLRGSRIAESSAPARTRWATSQLAQGEVLGQSVWIAAAADVSKVCGILPKIRAAAGGRSSEWSAEATAPGSATTPGYSTRASSELLFGRCLSLQSADCRGRSPTHSSCGYRAPPGTALAGGAPRHGTTRLETAPWTGRDHSCRSGQPGAGLD